MKPKGVKCLWLSMTVVVGVFTIIAIATLIQKQVILEETFTSPKTFELELRGGQRVIIEMTVLDETSDIFFFCATTSGIVLIENYGVRQATYDVYIPRDGTYCLRFETYWAGYLPRTIWVKATV